MKSLKNVGKLLLAVAVMAVVFCVFKFSGDYFSLSARYQRQHDEVSLRSLLATQIKPGDSKQRVSELLGPGQPDDGSYRSRLLEWQSGPHFLREFFPEGVRESDAFMFFDSKPGGRYELQFRDGLLINFDPTNYVGPPLLNDLG